MKKVIWLVLCLIFVLVGQAYSEKVLRATVVKEGEMAALPAGRAVLGPKKMIAVADFENKANWSSTWSLGEGMSEQLTTALMKTGQFIVLERQSIDDVLKEQDFGASGRTTTAGGAQMGKIYKAQILIRGAITEFSQESKGSTGIRIENFNIGGGGSKAIVTVDIRIYDTTTSQVLASKMCHGIAKTSGTTFSYSDAKYAFGTSQFKATPLGEATREAIERAVDFVLAEMANVDWQGKVVTVKEGKVFINAGARSGLKAEDKFTIYSLSEPLIDPDTGMNLGSEESKIGEIKVISVEDKFSKADVLSGEGFKRGDVVKFE